MNLDKSTGALERIRIRKFVRNLLIGKTFAGNNIYSNRVEELNDHEMPLVNIRAGLEKCRSHSNRHLHRDMSLIVECVIRANHRVDDKLDLFAAQVEAVLKERSLIPVGAKIFLEETEIFITKESSKKYGHVLLSFRVERITKERL